MTHLDNMPDDTIIFPRWFRITIYCLILALAIMLALTYLAGCRAIPTVKGPDLTKVATATPVSMQQTNADLSELRKGLQDTIGKVKEALAAAWQAWNKLPSSEAKESIRTTLVTVEQQSSRQEEIASGVEQKEGQITQQTKGAEKLAKENQSLKNESFRWLNFTLLPAGLIAIIASAALGAYGMGWIAKGVGVGGVVAVLLALFVPMLATLATVVVWSVVGIALAWLVYLLWMHRKSASEIIPALQDLKKDLPKDLLEKWFTGKHPAMSTYQSDSTQALVKAIKPSEAKP